MQTRITIHLGVIWSPYVDKQNYTHSFIWCIVTISFHINYLCTVWKSFISFVIWLHGSTIFRYQNNICCSYDKNINVGYSFHLIYVYKVAYRNPSWEVRWVRFVKQYFVIIIFSDTHTLSLLHEQDNWDILYSIYNNIYFCKFFIFPKCIYNASHSI